MSLEDDLKKEVDSIFRDAWAEQDTTGVPAPEDLRLNSNHAKHFKDAVVLYADLDGSTDMVDTYSWQFAAEMYKSYLRCASQIIKNEGGTITAYDGDRVMAVFVGDTKCSSAVRAALKINYVVTDIVRPSYAFYKYPFVLRHVIGIDRSSLHAARIGIRGDNDIVWVGHAANYAAKLCSLSEKPIWITKPVHDAMMDHVRYSHQEPGSTNMWERHLWSSMNNMPIYCTVWRRPMYLIP